MYSPLEQFKIYVVMPLNIFGIDLSITNGMLYTVLVVIILYLVCAVLSSKSKIVPANGQELCEDMFVFVHDLIKQQAGSKGVKYLPIMFVIFYGILFFNIIGLLPYSYTGTSQICYTFTMGFGMFIGIVLIGIIEQKVNFVKQFVPQTTGPILPLLVVIEIFSYCIRPFSLSIRLFANMLAGHTLMFILGSFAYNLHKIEMILGLLMGLPILAVTILEIGIAFLQAYVFLVLLGIYLRESLEGAH
jgi:ATP synthase subunit 6